MAKTQPGQLRNAAKGKGEGTPADIRADTRQARQAGMSLKNYERSAADRRADRNEGKPRPRGR